MGGTDLNITMSRDELEHEVEQGRLTNEVGEQSFEVKIFTENCRCMEVSGFATSTALAGGKVKHIFRHYLLQPRLSPAQLICSGKPRS